jgi:trehalose/maltose transport system permease protein
MKRALARLGFWVLVLAMLLFALAPFYYALISSLKPGARLFEVEYWPTAVTLENYAAVFREQPFATNIFNSILVCAAVVAISLAVSVTAAYAFARVRFRGRSALMMAILGVSMFPQIAVLAGMFELVRALGLYNHLAGLVLSYLVLTLPFCVWVLTAFMRDIPKELEQAALIDGAKTLTIIGRVFLPLLVPALVSCGLLAFVAAWNEFLFALTFTLTNDQRTVPVAIALISGASQHDLPWGNIMAASVIVTLPIIALVLVFQRRIVSGLVAGALKG